VTDARHALMQVLRGGALKGVTVARFKSSTASTLRDRSSPQGAA
jgi:hypothetical protein